MKTTKYLVMFMDNQRKKRIREFKMVQTALDFMKQPTIAATATLYIRKDDE